MSEEYDQITASHYAAYRPDLHLKILHEYFAGNNKHKNALDIGCGTGHSSIALATFCDKVIGIDPSQHMLQNALLHPGVEYARYNDEKLDFANDYFDIITFAGSLYYARSQHLLNELVRVSTHNAKVLVYDFEIYLEKICAELKMDSSPKEKSEYDHKANFSELDQKSITIEREHSKSYSVNISIANLSHLLLSSKDNFNILAEIFGDDTDLYYKVSQKLKSVYKDEKIRVEAMTYLTVYTVLK